MLVSLYYIGVMAYILAFLTEPSVPLPGNSGAVCLLKFEENYCDILSASQVVSSIVCLKVLIFFSLPCVPVRVRGSARHLKLHPPKATSPTSRWNHWAHTRCDWQL